MVKPKVGKSKNGEEMHYSVGAVIRKGGRYLLIDRVKLPLGFAGLAGHIDDGESEIDALVREVEEESGLRVVGHELLLEEELDWNKCSHGTGTHYWYLFECEVDGEIRRNERETKSIGWYPKEEIGNLNLEPVWRYWFSKMGVI